MEIIDNFLPEYQFKQIQSIFLGDLFPWYYNERIVNPTEEGYNSKDYQFTHTFFDKRPPWNGDQYHSSSFFSIIEPNLKLLGVTKLYRIKANLNPRTVFHRRGGYHIDYPDIKTAVYYVNTNNGWTEFKKGGRVKSVANRIVIFDSNLMHQGVTCTDEKRRVVINFNYEV